MTKHHPPFDHEPVLDDRVIDSILELNAEEGPERSRLFLQELVSMYSRESDKLMTQLDESVEKQDWQNTARVVHSLKSSSANLGARRLALRCGQIEDECRQFNNLSSETLGLLMNIRKDWVRAREALQLAAEGRSE